MPRTKSAKKALRQNIRRYNKNIERQKKLKSVIKKYKRMLAADDKKEEVKKQLSLVYKALDKMTKVDLIKPGKANRLKSRLSRKLVQAKA